MSKRRKLMYGDRRLLCVRDRAARRHLRLRAQEQRFQIQNEFKLINWVHLGVFSINRAVRLPVPGRDRHDRNDGVDLAPDAGPPQPGPDRRRGPLLADARQHHPRQHGRVDGGQVVSVHRRAVSVHLVLQSDRLPAAADQLRGDLQRLRRPHPVLRPVRRDSQHLGSARAGAGRVHRLQLRGDPRPGPDRLRQEPDPGRGPAGRSCS